MATKHTGNTQFASTVQSLGVTRWQFALPPVVPRGYVIDMRWSPAQHPHGWYAVALVQVKDVYRLRGYGVGNLPECPLDDADLQAILAGDPLFDVVVSTTDEKEATKRLERGVGHVMHNLLGIGAEVTVFWARVAQRDGSTNIWDD